MKKLICIITWTLLSACSSQSPHSPEEQVRHTLAAIEAAAEERSLSDIMQYVSRNYRDHEGRSIDEIKRTAQIYLLSRQNIHIFTRISSIEIDDKLATVELSAAMAGTAAALASEELRLRADTHRFSLVLALEEDNWRLTSASWQRGW